MLKTIGALGLLAMLGGGTYVAVQKCGSSSAECPLQAAVTAVGEACTTCCETDAVAKTGEKATDAPCPVEAAPATEVTKAEAAVEPAAAPAAQ